MIVARIGEEALDYLFMEGLHSQRSRQDEPGMVLLDLRLPGMDGLEVLKLMRADPRTKIVPVVVLTMSNKNEIVIQSYDLGPNSFVCKPVDFGRFIEAAQQLGISRAVIRCFKTFVWRKDRVARRSRIACWTLSGNSVVVMADSLESGVRTP